MTIKAATHGKGCDNLRYALTNHEPFTTSGSLKAVDKFDGYGRLNSHEADQLEQDHAQGIVYYVYSYATPIAWVRKDGQIHIVDQRFSVTTSKHQGRLYLLGGV